MTLHSGTYTIERVTKLPPYGELADFYYSVVPDLCELLRVDMRGFDVFSYCESNLVWVCRRNGKLVGVMFARLYPYIWDTSKIVLFQDGLFCIKSSGKAAFLLLETFIDFGRSQANLIFTCRTKHTNVKEKSLERLGFEKSEELYSMRV